MSHWLLKLYLLKMCVDVPVVLGEAGEDVELSLWFDVSVEADGTDDGGVEVVRAVNKNKQEVLMREIRSS